TTKQNVLQPKTKISKKSVKSFSKLKSSLVDKGKPEKAKRQLNLGFVAQDIEKVLPNLVITDKNGYKLVNYIGIIPVLTKAVQQLSTKVDKLEKEVNELRRKLDDENSGSQVTNSKVKSKSSHSAFK